MTFKPESIVTSKVCLYALGSAAGLYLIQRWRNRSQPVSFTAQSTVLITGCDTGLGYSMAIHCKEKLHLNVLATCVSGDSVGARNLETKGITVVVLHLENDASIRSCHDTVEEILNAGSLDLKLLINNAAVMTFGEFDWRSIGSIEKEVSVNLLGPIKLTKLFMDRILAQKTRLVNICSHCSLETLPGLVPYALSKSALLAWTNGLRVELSKYDVKVVAVVPGTFYTQSSIMSSPQYYISEMCQTMAERPATIRSLYGDYFHRYLNYVGSIARFSLAEKKPACIDDAQVMGNVHKAMTDDNPRALYICNNQWRYRFYHGLFRMMPVCYLKDRLLVYFMQMPAYRPYRA